MSAGVLVAASTAQLWETAPIYGTAALSLASLALICAAIALRPERRINLSARQLSDRFLDSERSVISIGTEIANAKVAVVEERNAQIRARARWITAGTIIVAAAAVALTIVFSMETLGR